MPGPEFGGHRTGGSQRSEEPVKLNLLTTSAALALTAGVGLTIAHAAAPPAAATAPKPAVTVDSLVSAAKVAAGTEFPGTFTRLCIAPVAAAAPVAPATVAAAPAAPAAPAAAAPAAPAGPPRVTWYAQPAKIGDNLYFIGEKGHNAFALVASNGDMIIIDNLYDYAGPEEIIGGLKKLGLDPNKAKFNIISHAHGDHDGAVKFTQDSIPGIKIIYGTGDWAAVDARTNAAQKVRHDPDSEGTDGRVVTVGDVSVKIVTMPGHTPGTLSFLFEYKYDGKPTKVAYVGGTAINFTGDAAYFDQYIASSAKFGKAAVDYGATVLMSNHTEFDNGYYRSMAVAAHKPGDPNDYEVGAANVKDYFEVVSLCAQAAKLRATGKL
jgi:metallo-beta-lactamase class B